MTEDIICVDGEIRTASREIKEYLDSMISSISSYNAILRRVQKNGIKDELIRAKIGNLSTLLTDFKESMLQLSEKFNQDVIKFVSDFEKNDAFTFPLGWMGEIEVLISMLS